MVKLYPSQINELNRIFERHNGTEFREHLIYIPQIQFFSEIFELIKKAERNGLQHCFPTVCNERKYIAKDAYDITYNFPIGFEEVEGIHSRTDFDLSQHAKYSKKDMSYIDQEDGNKKYIPYVIETSAGRLAFNEAMPEGIEYVNRQMFDKSLKKMIEHVYHTKGSWKTIQMHDAIKDVGYKNATFYGATLCMDDILVPAEKKSMVEEANKEVEKIK